MKKTKIMANCQIDLFEIINHFSLLEAQISVIEGCRSEIRRRASMQNQPWVGFQKSEKILMSTESLKSD